MNHGSLPPSPTSSVSSIDEEEVNCRISPHWPSYQEVLFCRGFRLDTVRDVKEFYTSQRQCLGAPVPGYVRVCGYSDDNALCPDAGLPDRLFRGARISDGKKVMVKAAHKHSRELDVIRVLSTPPLRYDSRNHTIPVLDLVEIPKQDVVLIVMEEWSSQLFADSCCLKVFLGAMRQCIEVGWRSLFYLNSML